MENKNTPTTKTLSWKRFIPLIAIICLGIILVFLKDSTKTTVCWVVTVLQTRYRVIIVNFIGTLIGMLHFYYVGRHNENFSSDMIRICTSLFTSIATAIGYAYMMNSGLNFAVGIINDLFLSKPFFIYRDQVDYVPISLITLFIIFMSGYLLWKLAEDFLYEIAKPSSDAEGIPEPKEQIK